MASFEEIIASLMNVLGKEYIYGITLEQIVYFLITLIVFVLIGKTIYYFFKHYVRKLTGKTKTQIDDILIDILEEPIVFLLFTIGLYIGFQFFTITDQDVNLFLNNIIGVLVTLNLVWITIRLVDAGIEKYLMPLTEHTKSKLDDQLIPILQKLVKAGVVVIAITIILGNFGYDVTALIAGLGIGGLAFAFAAKDTLANVFGGLTVFIDKPFFVKDAVQFGNIEGEVVKVGLRTTRIRDWDGRIITIPNSNVSGQAIKNISSEKERRHIISLGLVYDTSMKKFNEALTLTKTIINNHPGVNPDKTTVRFDEFAASSLNIKAIYFIKDLKNKFDVMHDINMQIKEEFEKAGLDFAFPTQTVYQYNYEAEGK